MSFCVGYQCLFLQSTLFIVPYSRESMKHVSWLNLEIKKLKTDDYYIFMIFFMKCSTKESISLLLRRAPCTEAFIIFCKVLYKRNYQLLLSQSTLHKAFYGRYTFQNIPLELILDYELEKQCIQYFYDILLSVLQKKL